MIPLLLAFSEFANAPSAPTPDPPFNWIGLIAALGGGAGIALMFERVFKVFDWIKKGVSARESKRKADIIASRDEAIAEALAANERADTEWSLRRRAMSHAARLSWQLERAGLDPLEWPEELEDTEPVARNDNDSQPTRSKQ